MATRPLPTSRTSAGAFGRFVPGALLCACSGPAWRDLRVEIYRRRRREEGLLVPAVAEPLIVWITAGAAQVEEREIGGSWSGRDVSVGDFYLTVSPTPYELRWNVTSDGDFENLLAYVSLPTMERAFNALGLAGHALREVSGERDEVISLLLESVRTELMSTRPGTAAFVNGLAQSLAVHLARAYSQSPEAEARGGLPAATLRRVKNLLESRSSEEVSIAELAREVDLSVSHFSRAFKRTVGLSPSHYLMQLRVTEAARLLRETHKSILEIGLEVGYSSQSHFSRVFHRLVGVAPSEYRGRI